MSSSNDSSIADARSADAGPAEAGTAANDGTAVAASARGSRRPRRTVLAVALSALILGAGVAATRLHADAAPSSSATTAAAPAAAVDVAQVVHRQIVDWQSYSGRLEAVHQVEVRALVSGTLTAVHFSDGARVNKGDPLFTIDPRPYAVEVERARAQLAGAEARSAYTANELARGERLLANNAIARRDFESRQNDAREAAALLQAAQAALSAAQLNLGYTRITAPVAGRVSRANVTVGNVVAAGGATPALTTLVSVAELYASFDVDEQSFLRFVNTQPSQAPAGTKRAGYAAPVFLGLANEDGYPREGRIDSVDNRLDTSSGTIRVRARFDNRDGVLLPGLYARIRLGAAAPRDAVLIDERAIGTDQDKSFVLVVDDQQRTAYRQIRTGASFEGLRIVENGLSAGERIVVNGMQRVRPGDSVQPQTVSMQGVGQGPAAVAGLSRTGALQ